MSASNDGRVDGEVDRSPKSNDQREVRPSNQCVTCQGTGQIGIPGGPCYICQGTGQLPSFHEAHLRDRIIAACVAGCSCPGLGTKSPEVRHHDPICRYRVLMECLTLLDAQPDETSRDDARDAARYRWLRQARGVYDDTGRFPQGDSLDECCDAFMANQDSRQTPAPSGHAGLGTAGRALSPGQSPEEPSEPRGKPCTCPDTSASACGVERGHKLGELWYCRRAAEKATAARSPEVCGCPYGQCRCDDGSGGKSP